MHMIKNKAFILFSLLLFVFSGAMAQKFAIKGSIEDTETKQALEGVIIKVEGTEISTVSDARGAFSLFEVPEGDYPLSFTIDGYVALTMDIKIQGQDLELRTVNLVGQRSGSGINTEDFIPTITLSEEDLEQETENQNISGVLSASRDVFVSAAAFTFGPARFRIRGYDSENTLVYFNGVPVNELESGRVFWNDWGGLNDVTRNREVDIGLGAIPYSFGGIGGATSIDTRATSQRKQLRLSYSLSNRSYRNRLMATYSTGLLKNGWAFSLSGSRRWADEGFIEGTFYDAWAYFLSVDKVLNPSHRFNLTAFGAPIKRGRSGVSTQEMYDLVDNNYYNPHWGFQNGEKRNSRVANTHQPVIILRHDWKIDETANLTTSMSYQFGRNGTTRLDWFDAPDPRPDYYRKLPSFFFSENDVLGAEDAMNNILFSVDEQQVNWQQFYDVNRNSLLATDVFPNILEDQNFSGRWSQYIIEENRFDSKEFNFLTNYQKIYNDHFTLNMGITYQSQVIEYFKVIEDLLGGDFYVNIDRFALRDNLDANAIFLNLEDPNLILQEGDVWGYDYDANINKMGAWAQGLFSYRKLDLFLAANVSRTQFWRTGNYRNGRFPDSSLGDSEVQTFSNYGLKGGLTYKVDGRNYFFANGSYRTRAPFFRNAYVSPRTRNQVTPDLKSENIYGGEVGYYLRSPGLKVRATAYYTKFENTLRIIRFYNDFDRAFGNYVLSDLDRRHMGLELAVEAKISAELSLSAVAALGEHIFTSRANGTVFQDQQQNFIQSQPVYSKNYRVPGQPQNAYTLGINYRSPKYWFANLNFNYFNNIYIDFSPIRRTAEAVLTLDPDSDRYQSIVEQERVDAAFTVDLFGGKSFKFGRNFVYLTVGVSNILDKRDFITGGFEQLRFDFDLKESDINTFPSRYFYSFGRNFFINVSYRY